MADSAKWYVVHTYSGYANTVKATIEKHVENRNMHDLIHEVKIPLETVTDEQTEYRTLFPEPVTWKGWWDDEDSG